MVLLDYLGEFGHKENRIVAARKIASFLKAEDLLIFIRDRELHLWLPAPGFPQSMPNGVHWKSFLDKSDHAVQFGEVPYGNRLVMATAVQLHQQAVGVLIGGSAEENEICLLKKVLQIVGPLLIQEQLVVVAESKAKNSAKEAEKSERLTITLESIRQNLMVLLEENSKLLYITKQQNEELAAANEELTASNEEVVAGLEELNLVNNRLLSINADLDNFIYTASHDLKSPVSNIEGLLCMLTRRLESSGWEDKQTLNIIEMMNTSISRFKDNIAGLTEVIKVEKEAYSSTEYISLQDTINDVKADLYLSISEKDAKFYCGFNEQVHINFSRKNLKSIIYNLLSNAIKYSDPSRQLIININLSEEKYFFVLSVKDNGLGMDTSDKDKIFGLFKRQHTHVEGTGIGLYIIKKIIEAAGGKIEVESTIGVGSTFRVYFKK